MMSQVAAAVRATHGVPYLVKDIGPCADTIRMVSHGA
jgi:hypothetical protein